MSKYSNTHDPYIDPRHQILINRLGITNQEELERVESALVGVRIFELSLKPISGHFDLAHLQRIHQHLFGEIYEWAGELRTVDITKGQTRFAHYVQIAEYAPQITQELSAEAQLKGLPPHEFSKRAGHYMGELNVLHPFREGNGRALRTFIAQLAREAGYGIRWNRIDREANIRASIQAYYGDSSGLSKLIESNLFDYDQQMAMQLALDQFGSQITMDRARPGHAYVGKIVGATDRYVVQQDGNAPDHMILHQRQRLVASMQEQVGTVIEIDYAAGDVGVCRDVDTPTHQTQIQKDRDWEL